MEENREETKGVEKPEWSSECEYQPIYNDEVVENLTKGLLASYQPHLDKTRDQLKELTHKQEVLIDQLHNENLKVSWTQNSVDLIKMFDTITTYHNKLNGIKKDMRYIHDKNLKLKKRAIRLQQYKEKMQYLQNQQKDVELKREQDLIGKSSKPTE